MKLCKYTNFDALFSSVEIDFPFLCLNQSFEAVKFVYCVAEFTENDNITLLIQFCRTLPSRDI